MRTTIIELEGRKLFLLPGLLISEINAVAPALTDRATIDELIAATRKDPDAVAFGRTAGKWVAAA